MPLPFDPDEACFQGTGPYNWDGFKPGGDVLERKIQPTAGTPTPNTKACWPYTGSTTDFWLFEYSDCGG